MAQFWHNFALDAQMKICYTCIVQNYQSGKTAGPSASAVLLFARSKSKLPDPLHRTSRGVALQRSTAAVQPAVKKSGHVVQLPDWSLRNSA